MDKIREVIETLKKASGLAAYIEQASEDQGLGVEVEACGIRGNLSYAIAALSAPVASDARDAAENFREWFVEWFTWPMMGDEKATTKLAEFFERFAAERERKAREEEREACAERAVAWQKKLCEDDDWPCLTCTECVQLRAAIKEAGNGNA